MIVKTRTISIPLQLEKEFTHECHDCDYKILEDGCLEIKFIREDGTHNMTLTIEPQQWEDMITQSVHIYPDGWENDKNLITNIYLIPRGLPKHVVDKHFISKV